MCRQTHRHYKCRHLACEVTHCDEGRPPGHNLFTHIFCPNYKVDRIVMQLPCSDPACQRKYAEASKRGKKKLQGMGMQERQLASSQLQLQNQDPEQMMKDRNYARQLWEVLCIDPAKYVRIGTHLQSRFADRWPYIVHHMKSMEAMFGRPLVLPTQILEMANRQRQLQQEQRPATMSQQQGLQDVQDVNVDMNPQQWQQVMDQSIALPQNVTLTPTHPFGAPGFKQRANQATQMEAPVELSWDDQAGMHFGATTEFDMRDMASGAQGEKQQLYGEGQDAPKLRKRRRTDFEDNFTAQQQVNKKRFGTQLNTKTVFPRRQPHPGLPNSVDPKALHSFDSGETQEMSPFVVSKRAGEKLAQTQWFRKPNGPVSWSGTGMPDIPTTDNNAGLSGILDSRKSARTRYRSAQGFQGESQAVTRNFTESDSLHKSGGYAEPRYGHASSHGHEGGNIEADWTTSATSGESSQPSFDLKRAGSQLAFGANGGIIRRNNPVTGPAPSAGMHRSDTPPLGAFVRKNITQL